MNNNLNNFKDEAGEILLETVKIVKKQLTPKPLVSDPGQPPLPSKKILNQLNQATIELSQIRLKKIREELDKQKLKKQQTLRTEQTLPEQQKPKDDIVAQTLRSSKSTGEFGRQVGG